MLRIRHFTLFTGILVTVTFCSAFSLVGQTPVSQEVVDRHHARAREICRSTPYRIRSTIEDRTPEDVDWRPYSQSLTEYAGGNSHHKGKYLETITFERKTYIRQRDGSWKVQVPVETHATVRQIGSGMTEWVQKEGASPTNGETVRKDPTPVAEWVQERTDLGPNGFNVTFLFESWFKLQYLSDGSIHDHHNTGKVVFDDIGRFVLTETITFEPRRRVFIRRLEEFEYDENIRIVPPTN